MEKLIDQLKTAKKDSKERIEQLAETIKNDKETLRSLENDHQNLILEDKEDQADELFNKIYDLKRDISKNEGKYKILSQPTKTPAKVKEIANDIINKVDEEKERLAALEKKKEEELEELREVYFKKIEEIGKVNREQEKVNEYKALANQAINPQYQAPYPSSYESDMRRFHFKIDSENLIYHALQGKRDKGVTR